MEPKSLTNRNLTVRDFEQDIDEKLVDNHVHPVYPV